MVETHEYDDIINLPHHISKNHKPMSREARAAQFAPFAALTGHEDALKETERLTENKKIIDEYYYNHLDEIINQLKLNIKSQPKVSITYFVPDMKKNGGKYIEFIGNIKKIDTTTNKIVLVDKTKINFKDIIDIQYLETED